MPVRAETAEDVDPGAQHGEGRVANGDAKRGDRAVPSAVGRRDYLGIQHGPVIPADHVDRVADRHGARVCARPGGRGASSRPPAVHDLGPAGRSGGAAADHELPRSERGTRRIVSRLEQAPL